MLLSTPNVESVYEWRTRLPQMWPASGCWLAIWKKLWPAAALHTSRDCAIYIMTRYLEKKVTSGMFTTV